MQPRTVLALLLFLVDPCAAESVRETEVMDPQDFYSTRYYSGALPDDEDVGKNWREHDSHPEDFELSGSGDEEYTKIEEVTYLTEKPEVTMDNHIPDDESRNKDPEDPKVVEENEILQKEPPVLDGREDVSNKVAMASATHESIFERTEVLAALIAGGVVGLLFAVFLILLLVYRMKKKDEGSYDLGKKPIYKKAPTNEFFA
ncbi:syndecan-4 [Ornithorhynchus anatinus]|uniref:Syndecan n=1 Tax=Ornithorhynchus anatinus TaxID=9258 RepID=A0A6I8NFN4_ORNAN|nr:syndecan-4 [Ornithorhynchus anatinus]